jgi:hypothetical protein
MSLHITQTEAQALTAFVERVRPEWDRPGILAAIRKAQGLGSAAAIGAALCRLAENRDLRTPALLAEPGPHWAGTTVATRPPPTMCADHPTSRALDCRQCAAETVAADQAKIRALHDELRKAKA